jgi:hypothetical protein
MGEQKEGYQAMALEVLEPEEEATLQFIKDKWEHSKPSKVNFKDISEQFLKKKYGYSSEEKARQLALSLYRKGQILIDIKGRERLCRPNHVTVFSKRAPEDFRTITIIDEETNYPVSRVWFSVFKEKGKYFLNISESKREKGGWKTVNNIVIPPEALDEFLQMGTYMCVRIKELKGGS